MTSHNKTSEKQAWISVKAKLIARFGTVKNAAIHIDCHPNALRGAAIGKCPHVARRMKQQLRAKAEVLGV